MCLRSWHDGPVLIFDEDLPILLNPLPYWKNASTVLRPKRMSNGRPRPPICDVIR